MLIKKGKSDLYNPRRYIPTSSPLNLIKYMLMIKYQQKRILKEIFVSPVFKDDNPKDLLTGSDGHLTEITNKYNHLLKITVFTLEFESSNNMMELFL